MLIEIPHVLGRTELEKVRKMLAACTYVDGSASAEPHAGSVKNNDEVARDDAHLEALNDIVMGNLVRHPRYRAGALPRHVATPIYARYRPNQGYGTHIDNPLMGAGQPYRSDIAVTLFLSDPADYTGGELVIDAEFGERSVKLDAGDAVLYPASFTHRVDMVSAGERLVAVTWIQSLVRDLECRRLLFEISQTRELLRQEKASRDALDRIDAVYANLMRRWAEL